MKELPYIGNGIYYTFSQENIGKMPREACFSTIGDNYVPSQTFYIRINTLPIFMDGLLEEVRSKFKNISAEVVDLQKIRLEKDAWGDKKEKVECGKEYSYIQYLLKFTFSDKYIERARYMATILMGVLFRMICLSEAYMQVDPTPEKVDLNYIIKINNIASGGHSYNYQHYLNSNHVFYVLDGLTEEMILWMDNVELMNKVFSDVRESRGSSRYSEWDLDVGKWCSQTAIINAIKLFLEANPGFIGKQKEKEILQKAKPLKKKIVRKKKIE